jgi:signal transduction histidine kinase/CheY-like chemotaxis protein
MTTRVVVLSIAVPSEHDIIHALGEDLPVGIWVARAPHGELVYANRTFNQILGMGARDDVQAGAYAPAYNLVTTDGQPYPEERLPFVRALQEKRVVEVDDIMIQRPDGVRVAVRAYARPVNEPITHVIIAFADITREVEAQRARAESEARLQLAQRLEAVGTLAGGIAHDFNNLILGVKLIAAELAATERDPRRRAQLGLIDDITERSALLTRSLLGFARQGKHRAIPVGLNDVVAMMRELLSRSLPGIELGFELDASQRGTVVGDQSQLEQVIMNLVVNARDAVGGSGRVCVRTRDAELTEMPQDAIGSIGAGRYVVLEVSDDGHGIPAELRTRVFEPYFTTKTQGPERGTGLGLATVLGIAESHHGAVEVDVGLDGRGTTLRVFLPAAGRPAAAPHKREVAPIERGTGTILVIDDDPIVRNSVANALEAIGYQTVEASSGREAIEQVERGIDLHAILLDMVMPGMAGKETYLVLRDLTRVPVVLMSGYTLNEEVQQILDLGVRAFVSKPYSIETLASVLRFEA